MRPPLLPRRLRHLRRGHALHLGAEPAQDAARLPHGRLDLRRHVVEEDRLAEGHAQALDAGLQRAEDIVRGDAGRRLVGRVRALERLMDERRIFHAAGERPHAVERPGERIDAGPADTPDRRLQPDRPAERGGDAHRAAGVASEGHRHQARAHGHARSAARSARRVRRGVPGVVRRAVVVIDADPAEGELHGVRLAHQHHARRSEPADGGAVARRHVAARGAACPPWWPGRRRRRDP